MKNSACQKFLEVLNDGLADQIRIGAAELAASIDLDPGQTLTWLSSAWVEGAAVHIFFCEAEDEDEVFMLTRHTSGEVLLGFDGPYASFARAKQAAGVAAMGWTDG